MPSNTQAFEASLAAQHYAAAVLIERPAGYALGNHEHPFDAKALITQGEITIAVGGVERCYKAGDVFELARGTLHTERAGEAGVAYLAGRRSD